MEVFFKTRLDYKSNFITINIGNNKFYVLKPIQILIYSDTRLLHINNYTFSGQDYDDTYWYSPGVLSDFKSFEVVIKHDDKIIFEDFHRIRDNRDNIIPKIGLFIWNLGAMGDTFSAEPIIRKLSQIYEQKIRLYTYHPRLFINHPCVDSIVEPNTYHSIGDFYMNVPEEDLKEYNIFYTMLNYKLVGVDYMPHWTSIDLRQMAATQCGFTLLPDEMNYHFYPNSFQEIEGLPDKFVCINPSIGSAITWKYDKWQILIDLLNDLDINVVIIGQNNKELEKQLNGDRTLNVRKGIDLSWKADLSQAWHIIEKSDLFITHGSFLLLLASTTDTNILMLGNENDIRYQIPYRKGKPDYKFEILNGFCKHHSCTSNPNYSVRKTATVNFELILMGCYLGLKEPDCYPSVEQIYQRALNILKKENKI